MFKPLRLVFKAGESPAPNPVPEKKLNTLEELEKVEYDATKAKEFLVKSIVTGHYGSLRVIKGEIGTAKYGSYKEFVKELLKKNLRNDEKHIEEYGLHLDLSSYKPTKEEVEKWIKEKGGEKFVKKLFERGKRELKRQIKKDKAHWGKLDVEKVVSLGVSRHEYTSHSQRIKDVAKKLRRQPLYFIKGSELKIFYKGKKYVYTLVKTGVWKYGDTEYHYTSTGLPVNADGSKRKGSKSSILGKVVKLDEKDKKMEKEAPQLETAEKPEEKKEEAQEKVKEAPAKAPEKKEKTPEEVFAEAKEKVKKAYIAVEVYNDLALKFNKKYEKFIEDSSILSMMPYAESPKELKRNFFKERFVNGGFEGVDLENFDPKNRDPKYIRRYIGIRYDQMLTRLEGYAKKFRNDLGRLHRYLKTPDGRDILVGYRFEMDGKDADKFITEMSKDITRLNSARRELRASRIDLEKFHKVRF